MFEDFYFQGDSFYIVFLKYRKTMLPPFNLLTIKDNINLKLYFKKDKNYNCSWLIF